MKILTNIHNIDNIDKLSEVADGFIIGTSNFSKHITFDFKENILSIIERLHNLKKEVFIEFNRMFTDKEINLIDLFLSEANLEAITGFIVADIGLLKTFKKYDLLNKFIYNPETLLTNHFDFNYLKAESILGAFASKEITAKDILEIGLKKELKLFIYAHGHMSMFYTKRQILNLYTDYMKKDNIYDKRTDLRLKEPKRDLETYPVYQDISGTHVFRGHVLSTLAHMETLKPVLDYIVINTLFQSDDYAWDVIKLYKEDLNEEHINQIKDKYEEIWHEGFLTEKSMIKGD